MADMEVSIVINRPIDEVFALLTDEENNVKWRSGTVEAEKTTPITVSVAIRVFDSTTQIRKVPSSSIAVPPSNG